MINIGATAVRFEGFCCFKTYEGVLEGPSTAAGWKELNTQLIERVRGRADSLLGHWPLVFIPGDPGPSIEAQLPPWTCIARLWSPETKDSDAIYSVLLVSWFAPEIEGAVETLVPKACCGIEWRSKAADRFF